MNMESPLLLVSFYPRILMNNVTTRGQFPKISLITVNFSAIQLSIFWHSTHNY